MSQNIDGISEDAVLFQQATVSTDGAQERYADTSDWRVARMVQKVALAFCRSRSIRHGMGALVEMVEVKATGRRPYGVHGPKSARCWLAALLRAFFGIAAGIHRFFPQLSYLLTIVLPAYLANKSCCCLTFLSLSFHLNSIIISSHPISSDEADAM